MGIIELMSYTPMHVAQCTFYPVCLRACLRACWRKRWAIDMPRCGVESVGYVSLYLCIYLSSPKRGSYLPPRCVMSESPTQRGTPPVEGKNSCAQLNFRDGRRDVRGEGEGMRWLEYDIGDPTPSDERGIGGHGMG